MINVAVINGGRGAAGLITALLKKPNINLTSIVNAYDDGKSTGEIRKFFGMLGPSDIRKVQELMLPKDDPNHKTYKGLFNHRFSKNIKREDAINEIKGFLANENAPLVGFKLESLYVRNHIKKFLNNFINCLNIIEKLKDLVFNFEDCSIMNCIYAGAFLHFNRNISDSTLFFGKLFNLTGNVIATNIENKYLVGLRENGEMLYSEAEIVELRSNVRIERIYLLDDPLHKNEFEKLSATEKRHYLNQHNCHVPISQSVALALKQADLIIYSAGTQHSSLYPSYISTGLSESIANNKKALKIFVTNIGADYETPKYKASDYILGAYKYLNLTDLRKYSMEELFDYNFINNSYNKGSSSYVKYDEESFKDINVKKIVKNYESKEFPGKHDGDLLVDEILLLREGSKYIYD